jgi:hypothetical protein
MKKMEEVRSSANAEKTKRMYVKAKKKNQQKS